MISSNDLIGSIIFLDQQPENSLMSDMKTKENNNSVDDFLNSVAQDRRRTQGFVVKALMERTTGFEAKMWGANIVGYGRYHYKYASGREGDYFLTGFSPRKHALTIYIMPGFSQHQKLLSQLGKHKHSKSCLYITNLEKVDLAVLEELIRLSVEYMQRKYPV